MTLWNCPLCWKKCEIGTRGCDKPQTCPEPKNINWHQVYKHMKNKEQTKGIGISEIANEEKIT